MSGTKNSFDLHTSKLTCIFHGRLLGTLEVPPPLLGARNRALGGPACRMRRVPNARFPNLRAAASARNPLMGTAANGDETHFLHHTRLDVSYRCFHWNRPPWLLVGLRDLEVTAPSRRAGGFTPPWRADTVSFRNRASSRIDGTL